MSNMSLRAVLSTGGRAAVATLGLCGVGVAATTDTDAAVLAAIERHRAALARHIAVCREEPATRSPQYGEWRRQENEAADECFDAVWSLLDEPATVSGVAALLAYIAADPDSFLDFGRECDDGTFSHQLVQWAAKSLAEG